MTDAPRREIAKICTIHDLLRGVYVVQEGWLPNYVESQGRKLSRVNIVGIVVSKPSMYEFFLDDGTGTIQIVDFNQQQKIADLKIGEPVLVIGRPRKNNETIFIACEMANNKQLLEEPGWISYRKEELSQVQPEPITESEIEEKHALHKTQEQEVSLAEEEVVTADVTGEDIVSFIKKKDVGEGCLIEEIISYFGNNIDDHVLTLITMGEIYEIKPGRVKVLE